MGLELLQQQGLVAAFTVQELIRDFFKISNHLARRAARPVAGGGIETTDSEGAGGGTEVANGGAGCAAGVSPLAPPGRFAAAWLPVKCVFMARKIIIGFQLLL